MTLGGEGVKGRKFTDAERKRLSIQATGRKWTEERKEQMSQQRKGTNIGHYVSSETCEKIRQKAIGRPKPEGWGENHSKKIKGRIKSAEEIRKISETHKGMQHTEETKKKMSPIARDRMIGQRTMIKDGIIKRVSKKNINSHLVNGWELKVKNNPRDIA